MSASFRGLAPNKRQAWTNTDQDSWHHMASLGHIGLNWFASSLYLGADRVINGNVHSLIPWRDLDNALGINYLNN